MRCILILSTILVCAPLCRADDDKQPDKKAILAAVRKVREYHEEMNGVRTYDEPPIPYKVGLAFRFPREARPLVLYIANEKELVLKYGENFWLHGFSTKGKATDRRVEIPGPLIVTGTKKYGADTIFIIEPFEPRNKPTEDEFKIAAAEEKRQRDKERADAAADAAERTKAAAAKKLIDDKANREKAADSKLRFAKQFLRDGKTDLAKQWLRDLIKDYADTKAAVEGERR